MELTAAGCQEELPPYGRFDWHLGHSFPFFWNNCESSEPLNSLSSRLPVTAGEMLHSSSACARFSQVCNPVSSHLAGLW